MVGLVSDVAVVRLAKITGLACMRVLDVSFQHSHFVCVCLTVGPVQ